MDRKPVSEETAANLNANTLRVQAEDSFGGSTVCLTEGSSPATLLGTTAQVTRMAASKILHSQILHIIPTHHLEKGKSVQKKLLVAALASGAFDAAFAGSDRILEIKQHNDGPDPFSAPKSREQKLQAMGLTVNSKDTATAVRYGYGQKPPVETSNCRAAQRRLKQQRKLAEKRGVQENCLPQPEVATV